MLNNELFFQKNSTNAKKAKLTPQKTYEYHSYYDTINLLEIKRILEFISTIRNRHAISLVPIVIDLGKKQFEDKLCYILLESICYRLISEEKAKLTLRFDCMHNIYIEGIKQSCLIQLNGQRNELERFKSKFKFDVYQSHFRRLLELSKYTPEKTSQTVQEIDTYLKNCGIQKEYSQNVSDVVGELIDNAIEHSESDCLIDIDVTNDYEKKSENTDSVYCGVNIVVLNFSNVLLETGIQTKIKVLQSQDLNTINVRYQKVLDAQKYHSKFWNERYTENDFYIVTSFQHKISSRLNKNSTGGTGLTCLIQALEEKSDAYECYVLTGCRKIKFIKNLLFLDDEKWIGFNDTKNYITDIPDVSCIQDSGIYFPGTAYNLNFVVKREVI